MLKSDANISLEIKHGARNTGQSVFLTMFIWAGLGVASFVSGADFNVDKAQWGASTDVGTFAWAIAQANQTFGTDTIHVQSDLEIDVDGAPTLAGENAWLTRITESVVIKGNHATLVGNPSYVTSGGSVATKTNIIGSAYDDPIVGSDVITVPAVSFAQIGERHSDNSSIHVEISNLNADGLASVALANQGSELTVSGGEFVNMVNYTGVSAGRGIFEANTGSILNLSEVSIRRAFPFAGVIDVPPDASVFFGAIQGLDSELNFQDSQIIGSFAAGAISWSGGIANVVSSVFESSGGLEISDSMDEAGVLNFVNSLLYMVGGETISQTNRIQALAGGEANIVASSILYDALYTDAIDDPTFPFGSNGMPLTATASGILNFNSSVVLPQNWDFVFSGKQPYSEFAGGNLMADDYSYIAATTAQDANAVMTLFENTNILTEGLAYDLLDFGSVQEFGQLPEAAFPSSNGVLLARIPDAGFGGMNQLMNPIDGSPILFDVYGNSRTRHGTRDIGAVQAAVPEPSTIAVFAALFMIFARVEFRRRRILPANVTA